MRPYGTDRVRLTAGKVILHARLAKGWTPRTEKTLTNAEFPGTAVYWDERYYEVLAADALPAGGVRYVLAEWRDDHTIREFRPYDERSEELLAQDYALVARQRKNSLLARLSSMVLGNLPAHVQNHLANELGLFPHRMTLWSLVPVLAATGACAFVTVDAMTKGIPNPIPDEILLLTFFMLCEAVFRYLVAMSQTRAMPSMLGILGYLLFWVAHPGRARLISPFELSKGEGLMTLPPPPGVAESDALEVRAPFLTLLRPAEQELLAERFGFDYRKHAFGITWMLLVCAALGVGTMWLAASSSISALISLISAGFVVLEQAMRLFALERGPAGSVFGVFVRPFARDLLGTR